MYIFFILPFYNFFFDNNIYLNNRNQYKKILKLYDRILKNWDYENKMVWWGQLSQVEGFQKCTWSHCDVAFGGFPLCQNLMSFSFPFNYTYFTALFFKLLKRIRGSNFF